VIESRIVTNLFGPKRDKVTREWRRLHNEELYGIYSSQNIIWVIKSRSMRWSGHVARMGKTRGACAYRALVEKPKGKRPRGRLSCRWQYNVKVSTHERGWGWGLV